MHPSPEATQTVRAWTRAAMAVECGRPPLPPRASGSVPAVAADLHDVLAAVGRQRVTEALDRHGEALDLPAAVREAVAQQRELDRRALAVRALETGRVQRALDAAGVRWMLVKGAALAAQTTGDPAARGRGDIDLVVAPADVRQVLEVLVDGGWLPRHRLPPVTSWAWRHLVDVDYEIPLDGPGSTVDLHWRLDPTHAALPSFEALWARRVTVDVGGPEVTTTCLRDSFVHACHHAAKDRWRWLRSLVDVHRLAREPEVWDARPVSRVERSTLRVTDACLGLPQSVPASTRDAVGRTSQRVVSRALAGQGRPVIAELSVPGVQTMVVARYRLAASTDRADVRRTVSESLAPLTSVVAVDDPSFRTAVPRVMWRRVTWFVRRLAARLRAEPDAVVKARRPS